MDLYGFALRALGQAAQDMAPAGVSTATILQAGGWSDEWMVKRCLRKFNAAEGRMAQLFRATDPSWLSG